MNNKQVLDTGFESKGSSELTAYQASLMSDKTLASLPRQTNGLYTGKLLGGKYEITEKIATGGWSTVYKAKRKLLDIEDIVAVKILHLNLSDKPQDIKRFYNEAAAIRELRHPNAIHLYDLDRDADGTIYMAMEFVHGKNLKQTIKDSGPFDVARMLNIITQICDVISTAHKHPKKIIHRDITPQNVMLTRVGEEDDYVKVLDFGIVKLRTHDQVSLTGNIVGTPLYMAPEQWKGECDERTDIYSLGVIMYEMLTGETPFTGDTVTLMNKHLNQRPQPFRKLNKKLKISRYTESIVFRCLEKNRDKRPQSIDELKLLLQNPEAIGAKYISNTRRMAASGAFLFILAVSALYLFFLQKKHEKTTTASSNVLAPQDNNLKVSSDDVTKKEQPPQSPWHDSGSNPLNNNELRKSIPLSGGDTPHESGNLNREKVQDVKGIGLVPETEAKTATNSKYIDKVVDNIPKYDIHKDKKKAEIKPDRRETLKSEIMVWLQEYKRAWEKGDIEKLKAFGQISSEKEEEKLQQHYQYVHDIEVSIQNAVIEVDDKKAKATVSFDRTDEWTDERGERHKEELPRIVKTLCKEDKVWKIIK